MELYSGHVTFNLFTVVDKIEDEREMKNNAHEGLSWELFEILEGFIRSKGYDIAELSANLNHIGEAKPHQIKWIEESKKKGVDKVNNVTGKTRTVRIEI